MRLPSLKPLFAAALAGLFCGTIGETLLFLEAQARRVESALSSDFRVVVFLSRELPDSGRAQLEARLRAIPGTQELDYVSREASLQTLRRQDPDLARSVALLGENPLQSAYEASLTPDAMVRQDEWARAAAALPDVGDVRFKPVQVRAIVQCQFYSRFLRLMLSLAAFFWIAGAAAVLWAAGGLEAIERLEGLAAPMGAAAAGSLGGMAVVLIAALPLRSAPGAWAAPGAWMHALLLAAGALGGVFAWEAGRTAPGRGHSSRESRRRPLEAALS